MTKKDFIKLADYIRESARTGEPFTEGQITCLAAFCRSRNSNFNRERWIGYIKSECGPGGGVLEEKTPQKVRRVNL
jgi:hypothetical protein